MIRILLVRFVIILLLYTFGSSVSAQINSSYSRVALGELLNTVGIPQRSMAGISASYNSLLSNNVGQNLNILQPASFGDIGFTGVDIGVRYSNVNTNDKITGNTFNSSYLIPEFVAIGFPISNQFKIGGMFGFRQVSTISYNTSSNEYFAADSINNIFSGNGGMYQFMVGVGKRFKNFNLGISTGALFGAKRADLRKQFYGNSRTAYQTSHSNQELYFSGSFLRLGAQYELNFKKTVKEKITNKYSLIFGATYEIASRLPAQQSFINSTQIINQFGDYGDLDTASYFKEIGFVNLPQMLSFGITINKVQTNNFGVFKVFTIGLEYDFTDWSNFKIIDIKQPTLNSNILKLGGEISPVPNFNNDKISLITYRFGVATGNDYILINNQSLQRSFATFGLGLPIRKYRNYENQYSIFNILFEVGNRSSSQLNVSENYFVLGIGFSVNDIWFIKRRYD
ncbi:MAG: hypothetical protein ORN85_07495 [Sediminibacterium sp.]|nr:hypothetical protein [Sediminibacterium sp.]